MGLKVNTKKPEVDAVEIGQTYGAGIYINWRNLASLMRKGHRINPDEGIGGVTVNEHGLHIYFTKHDDKKI